MRTARKLSGILLMIMGVLLVLPSVIPTGFLLTGIGSCIVLGLIFAGLGLTIL